MLTKVFILMVFLTGQDAPDEFYFTRLANCGDMGERVEMVNRKVTSWHCLSSEFLEVH